MKLKEFTDIDNDKKEDIGYDIIDDLKCHMRDDPMFYRKMYFSGCLHFYYYLN